MSQASPNARPRSWLLRGVAIVAILVLAAINTRLEQLLLLFGESSERAADPADAEASQSSSAQHPVDGWSIRSHVVSDTIEDEDEDDRPIPPRGATVAGSTRSDANTSVSSMMVHEHNGGHPIIENITNATSHAAQSIMSARSGDDTQKSNQPGISTNSTVDEKLAKVSEATPSNKLIKHFIQTDTKGTHWSDSHKPRNRTSPIDDTENDVRISFRLHDPEEVPYPSKFLSVHGYTCHAGILPPSLSGRAILNFTTTISTDLNILFVGDSITQQFAQGFYASVVAEDSMGSHSITRSFINGQIFGNSGLHVCTSIVAPTRGGGASAYWRVLELMSNRTERVFVNCKREKGFDRQEGKRLSRYRYAYPPNKTKNELAKVNTNRNNGATTWYRTRLDHNDTQKQYYQVEGFDCCVLRLQHGWMELQEITRERIVEEIELCNTVVGAKTVVVSTLPLNNNVLTKADWELIIKINDIIRTIAQNWKPPASEGDGVKYVLVQEFGMLTNQILWLNAQHIGYNITIPDFTKNDGWEKQGSEFLLHRYQGIKSMRHAPSIPMVCAYHIEDPFSIENKTAGQCFFNRISRDGMHWCVEALGPRYSASIACLLGCVYNGKGPSNSGDLRKCEQECNHQFMSIVPVHESWIGTNTTIFVKRES